MAMTKRPRICLLETDVLTCIHCKEIKLVTKFVKRSSSPNGYMRCCKACHSKYESKRRTLFLEKNPELRFDINSKSRERYKTDPEFRETFLASSKRNRRKHYLKSKFGLTTDDVAAMRQQQDNKCAICSATFDKTPHIDHNHTTGQVRGLLCENCNHGLGQFKDNSEIIEQAAKYLRRYE